MMVHSPRHRQPGFAVLQHALAGLLQSTVPGNGGEKSSVKTLVQQTPDLFLDVAQLDSYIRAGDVGGSTPQTDR
jgi:hypothetical protein